MNDIISTLKTVDFIKICLDRTSDYDVVFCGCINRCDLNSPSFGQRKGPSLEIEYNLEEKMDPNRWQEYPISISWPYIAKVGSFVSNYVFDIIYLNHNHGKSIQHMAKDILSKDASYHDKLVEHLQQNMDTTNKLDSELYETMHSWQIQFEHVCCIL